jgi:hypothetical protein
MKMILAFPENDFVTDSHFQEYHNEGSSDLIEHVLSPFCAPDLEWITLLDLGGVPCSVYDTVRLSDIPNLGALRMGWITGSQDPVTGAQDQQGMTELILRAWAENVETKGAFQHLRIIGWRFKDFRLNQNAARGLATYPALEMVIISVKTGGTRGGMVSEVADQDINPWKRACAAGQRIFSRPESYPTLAGSMLGLRYIYTTLIAAPSDHRMLTILFGPVDMGYRHELLSRQIGKHTAAHVEPLSKDGEDHEDSKDGEDHEDSKDGEDQDDSEQAGSGKGKAKGKAKQQMGDTLAEFGI